MNKTKKSTLFVLLLALMLAAIASVSASAQPAQTAYAAISNQGKLTESTMLSANLSLVDYVLTAGDGSTTTEVTLDGCGYKITRGYAQRAKPAITVKTGATLTIINAIIDGGFKFTYNDTSQKWESNSSDTASAPIIKIENGGRLILRGCTVQNNYSTADGGGIYIFKDAAADLFNTTVQNCQARQGYGGGIYNGGILAMVGGTVNNNYASGYGGGIFQTANENSALYINNKSDYLDQQVQINRNIAQCGAGLYIAGGQTWIYGTSSNLNNESAPVFIQNNVAGQYETYNQVPSGYGGGVYIGSTAQAHIYDNVQIAGNKAENGGGIYTSGQTWLGREGTTTEWMYVGRNFSANYGGGICSVGGSTWLGKIEFKKNESGANGGGIYIGGNLTGNEGNLFAITSTSSVSGNTAYYNGGGIYAAGVLTLEYKPYISGNKAGAANSTANSNVHLAINNGGKGKIKIVKKQTDNSDSGTATVPIGLSSDLGVTTTITTGYSVTNTLALSAIFTPDEPTHYELSLSGGDVQMHRFVNVTYTPFNSTGSVTTKKVDYATTYTFLTALEVGFARMGHTFSGWSTSMGGPVTYIEGTYWANADLTVYPVWKQSVYTLTYDGNGNTGGSMSTSKFTYGQTRSLSTNLFTKTGYKFLGWSFDQNATTPTYLSGASFTYNYTSDKTLYAVWSNKFDVIFDANGATGTKPSSVQQTSNSSFNLPSADGLTYEGCAFDGWLCDADNVTYQAGTSYTMPAKDVSFTAQWKPLYSYTVKHYLQNVADDEYTLDVTETLSGTGTTQAVAKNYDGYTAPTTIEQKEINADGTTQVDIYYTRNSYTVTFDANGGEFPANATTMLSAKYGANVSVEGITAPEKIGFVFTGWNTSSDGTGTAVDKSGNYTVTAETDQTLYAVYEAKAVTRLTGKSDSKKEWYVGEEIGDYYFTVWYNDETTEDISVATTGVEVTKFDTSTDTSEGETRTATIKYGGQQYSFNYTVVVRKYSITYVANGAMGTPYYQSPRPGGSEITVGNANGLTKTGYTFTGWLYSGDNRVYQPVATLTMPAQNVTFTAQWKLNAPTLSCQQAVDNNGSKEVTLTYNGNEQSITVTAAHDLGNSVSYAYQWWTGAIGIASKGTSATMTVTNVSESTSYICVVRATYGEDTAEAIYYVKVTVNQAEQAELIFSQSAITYAGENIDLSRYVSGGSGDGTISFSKVSSSNITHGTFGTNGVIQNVTKAGGTFTFKVKKAASSDGNYKAAEKEFNITINKGIQNVVIDDITSPVFGESYSLTVTCPTNVFTLAIITGGTATGKIVNGKLSITDRGANGTITVKATATATNLYEEGTATKTFTFAKATPTFTPNADKTICMGKALSDITLPAGFTWKAGQTLHSTLESKTYIAVYTPSDFVNYLTAEDEISITVVAHNIGTATSNDDGTHSHTCSVCSEIITENCTYGDWVITEEAGVNQDGSKYRVCTECGYLDTKVIPATHTCVYDTEFTVDIAPTCTTAGEKSRHCTTAGCNERTDITVIPALGHEWGGWTSNNNGTHTHACTHDGSHTETIDCIYEDSVVAPTCTTKGYTRHTCTVCGYYHDDTPTDEIAHTLTAHDAVSPTHTKSGNIAYWTCNVCNKYFSDESGETEISLNDIVLQATGHNYFDEWKSDVSGHWHECSCGDKADVSAHTPGAAATETTPQTCTTCGYVITPATGHVTHTPDTSKWYSDGTNHWHKCVDCEEKLDVAQHSGGTATCEHKAVCEICGAEYGELAAHSYGKWTYYSDTQHRRVCSVNASHVEYADHAWNDGEITTAPTHTATGVKTYTCADCGHTKTEIVPVTAEHTYEREVAEARYLKFAATCTQRAVYYKSCACDERGTATFEYGGYAAHTLTAHEAVAATCTQNGNIAYWSCSVCNKYFSDSTGETEITQAQTVIAAGHNYEFTRTVAPNLEAQTDGYDLWTCTRDENHTERRNIVEWKTLISDTVIVTVSGGTIQGQSGLSVIVDKNGSVTVMANAVEGKTFIGWRSASGEIVSENSTYTFSANADMTLTAVYEDVTPEPDGLSGGAIAGIAVGSVAVAGLGGFALFWFVIKKKSLADLLVVFKRK